ncbi:hypothetical protein X777_02146 [Ooceraea biroi]|uniref:Uncharacterized protein n=1 Tax=Ooceraea biroi TaxID=2015173 RepID=A0A026WPQ1_OOCBI|nr:hypothetical protein X777_02146 [Ooceraea biroi]
MNGLTARTRQSLAIGIDVAATKPRCGDVTRTRDKVQRLHVNPRDTVGAKLAASSPPRASFLLLRFLNAAGVCLPRPTRLLSPLISHTAAPRHRGRKFIPLLVTQERSETALNVTFEASRKYEGFWRQCARST